MGNRHSFKVEVGGTYRPPNLKFYIKFKFTKFWYNESTLIINGQTEFYS